MSDLGSQVYNLTMQNLVTLWIIDFNPVITFDTATDGILHVSAYKDGSNFISYNGQGYSYVGVQGSGFRSEINGQLPEPELVFDKASLLKVPKYRSIRDEYIAQTGEVYFDWRGARITRTRTTSNYLTDPTKGDVNQFLVDQITRSTKSTIDVKLTVSIGADRLNNDSVQELAANSCALRYRTYTDSGFVYTAENAGGCPYGNTSKSDWSGVPNFGNGYFNEDDTATTEANDSCSYTVKGCQLRFDPAENGLALPFLGKYKATGNDSSTDLGSV